jgi:alpha-L-fucosidase 2
LEDWEQKEKSHRHISNLYGLYPGNQISLMRTLKLAQASKVVLNQRGLTGNGWASAWKMGCWARLYDAEKAMKNFTYCMNHYTTYSLFSICSQYPQVDGMFGLSAALIEMLIQSHEGEILLLPALPASWENGEVSGLCARGGFEVHIKWEKKELDSVTILSKLGKTIPLRYKDHRIELKTEKGFTYNLNKTHTQQ